MVTYLESQGATIIGIACNTAHVFMDKIVTHPNTILVNLIDAVARIASYSEQNYLLLTSLTSKQQKLYHSYLDKYAVSFTETTARQQQYLDQAIGLVMAHDLTQAGIQLNSVLQDAKNLGLHNVIAGCTELPIAIDHSDNQTLTIIDSNDELAKELLRHYYAARGQRPL